jgi:hypothetical protein
MECTLLHHSNLLWHAAGFQGSVTIQLAMDVAPPVQPFWCSLVLDIEPPPIGFAKLEPFYLLRDALQTELSSLPHLSMNARNIIQRQIVWTVLRFTKNIHLKAAAYDSPTALVNTDAFSLRDLVSSTLQDLGINFDLLKIENILDDDVMRGIEYPPMVTACPCDAHDTQSAGEGFQCVNKLLDTLVLGAATTATALLLCETNASQTRVSADVFNGTVSSACSQHLFPFVDADVDSWTEPTSLDMLLGHLRLLVHGEANSKAPLPSSCLGVSAMGTTITFKALFDVEAFTEAGKFLSIYPGRVTAESEFRDYIQNWYSNSNSITMNSPLLDSWSIADGITFSPLRRMVWWISGVC